MVWEAYLLVWAQAKELDWTSSVSWRQKQDWICESPWQLGVEAQREVGYRELRVVN